MAVTTGMVGHGFYDRNSAPQMAAIAHVLPWVESAASDMHLSDPPSLIGLADFGCSEGRNSIAVMKRLVAACRSRTPRSIQTIHSDLPTNDFSELFTHLRPEGQSVFGDNAYSAVVGGSMFDQLLPPRSLHFATTFNAIGFLGRRPLDRLPDYILPNGPSKLRGIGHVSKEDHALFAQQARQDLEAFAQARATELVAGGKLLVQVFGSGDDLRTCDGIYDVLNDAMLELIDEGILARNDYETFYQPVYFRTLDELTSIFSHPKSPVAALFQLERAETYEVPVPFVEDFRRTRNVGQYACAYTDFFRAVTEPVLRLSFRHHRSLNALVTEVYERVKRLVQHTPEQYELHYVSIAALSTRRN